MTDPKRIRELLAYASVCFKNMTSPFETMHLRKMNVTLDECVDLGDIIASELEDCVSISEIEKATILFDETQNQPYDISTVDF